VGRTEKLEAVVARSQNGSNRCLGAQNDDDTMAASPGLVHACVS